MNKFFEAGRALPFVQRLLAAILRPFLLLSDGVVGRASLAAKPLRNPQRQALAPFEAQYLRFKPLGLLFGCSFLLHICLVNAQSPHDGGATGYGGAKPLLVGQKVPEEFWTKEHLFYVNGDTIRKTLEEYKGKMLVLDFWMSSCTRCLLHQKEINDFKEEYPEELAVIMVNSQQSREDYHKIWKYTNTDYFKKLGLTSLVSIIEDTYLEQLFVHYVYPTYVWINPRGNLQLQTFRNLLDKDYIAPFIDRM